MVSVQPNMQSHDELSMLFSRHMNFNPEMEAPRQQPSPTPVEAQPITYSISQHYHHSAHVTKPQPQAQATPIQEPEVMQRPSSEPPQVDLQLVETVLRNFNVDPAALTPSQIQLFRTAEETQQMRLLELWTICPPKRDDIPASAWSSTSVQQEEELARVRYDRQNQPEQQVMSLDGTSVQTADGTWAQREDSEPYMMSGYEELMRREQQQQQQEAQSQSKAMYNHYGNGMASRHYSSATDPVFMGPDFVRQQEQLSMASQYGAYEQSRGADAMDVIM